MTDEDVQRILHRAAELQASRTAVEATAQTSAHQGAVQRDDQSLQFLAEAAEEVGICRQDFALATAELTGSPRFRPIDQKKAEQARRWLANDERSFSHIATLPHAPSAVLAALRETLQGPDYRTEIANIVGRDPLTDGVLVLEPGSLDQMFLPDFTTFKYDMVTADFRQVLVAVRAVPDQPQVTQLTFHVDLDHAAVFNRSWGRGSMGVLGVVAGVVALGIAGAAGAGVPVLLAASLGTGFLTALGIKVGWQKLYPWGLGKGKTALKTLVTRVERSLRLAGLVSAGE